MYSATSPSTSPTSPPRRRSHSVRTDLSKRTTDDETLSSLQDDESSSVYTVYQSYKPNYTITKAECLQVYYVTTKGLDDTIPDLTMHRGKDSSGPIIAFAKYMKVARSVKLARGSHLDAQNAIWEDMRRIDKWSGVKYRWEMAVVRPQGGVERKGFIWKRTRATQMDAHWKKLSDQNYKLVDERTGELLVLFSLDMGATNLKRLGKFRIMDDKYGDSFLMMVFLSALSMRECED